MAKKIDINGLEHFKEKENAMIAGKPEATGTATATHAKDEYFYWKGTLHQATAAIAIGDTITLNTNVKKSVLTDDLCQLQTALNYYTEVSGTTPSITAEDGKLYVCGTLESLSFTPPAKGMTGVVFTCGTTPTVLTLPNTVTMPEDWDGTLVGGLTYELNFLDQRGVYQAWA